MIHSLYLPNIRSIEGIFKLQTEYSSFENLLTSTSILEWINTLTSTNRIVSVRKAPYIIFIPLRGESTSNLSRSSSNLLRIYAKVLFPFFEMLINDSNLANHCSNLLVMYLNPSLLVSCSLENFANNISSIVQGGSKT